MRSLFRRGRLDRELNDELAARLEMHTADNLRTGMPPENARRDALLKLGGGEQTKASRRERRGLPLLESLLQDLCFGLRMLSCTVNWSEEISLKRWALEPRWDVRYSYWQSAFGGDAHVVGKTVLLCR